MLLGTRNTIIHKMNSAKTKQTQRRSSMEEAVVNITYQVHLELAHLLQEFTQLLSNPWYIVKSSSVFPMPYF